MAKHAQEHQTSPHTSRSRLILVDDDPALLEALAGTLRTRLGHFTLDRCLNGMAGLDYVTEKAYDAIIVDWNMPAMNGLQFLGRVKQVPHCVPVVMISGHADEAMMEKALQAGAADFIFKPIDRDIFIQSVRRALNISRLRSHLNHQEALLNRTENRSTAIAEEISQSNKEWFASSELSSTEPPKIESEKRHFVRLDNFHEKLVKAHRETSALLQAAEEEMRQYACSRLRRLP